MLYTGLRRGDAVRLGRQHVKHGVATLTTEKTGTVVSLPILTVLQRTLDAGPCGDLSFIAGAKGRPFTKESFGNEFRDACRAAGINKSAHGLRKIGAIRVAEWSHGAADECNIWLDRFKDGDALHRGGQPNEAGGRRDASDEQGDMMGATKTMRVTRINISDIVPWRCAYPPAARRYAAMLRAGQKLPPIIVINYGGVYEIFDGMHRARAAKMTGRKTIEAKISIDASGA